MNNNHFLTNTNVTGADTGDDMDLNDNPIFKK